MTIHGLRATAVCDRRLQGIAEQNIASDIGMSVDMVRRYSRHIDQAENARVSRDKRERKSPNLKTGL